MTEKLIIEIETGDIDDTLALIYALKQSSFDIKCIIVLPGSPQQIGLVQKIVDEHASYHIPIGVEKLDGRSKLSPIYRRVYGDFKDQICDKLGEDLTIELCQKYPNEIIFVSLGPPKTLSISLQKDHQIRIQTWVAQGDFAVVDEDKILPKFKGMKECPTWNLGGACKQAEYLLKCDRIGRRYFISKNVCHGILYNKEIHKELKKENGKFAQIFQNAMDKAYYGREKKNDRGNGRQEKKIHDICTFREVSLYRMKNGWESVLQQGSNTFISVDYDKDLYWKMLTL
jgi:inosine-uridine nucleoside N-ribohydrolase